MIARIEPRVRITGYHAQNYIMENHPGTKATCCRLTHIDPIHLFCTEGAPWARSRTSRCDHILADRLQIWFCISAFIHIGGYGAENSSHGFALELSAKQLVRHACTGECSDRMHVCMYAQAPLSPGRVSPYSESSKLAFRLHCIYSPCSHSPFHSPRNSTTLLLPTVSLRVFAMESRGYGR